MSFKKVDLHFDEELARFEVESHDFGTYSVALTEYQKNEEKSTDNHVYIEPRFTSEVFVSQKEIKSIIRALQYLVDEDDFDATT